MHKNCGSITLMDPHLFNIEMNPTFWKMWQRSGSKPAYLKDFMKIRTKYIERNGSDVMQAAAEGALLELPAVRGKTDMENHREMARTLAEILGISLTGREFHRRRHLEFEAQ